MEGYIQDVVSIKGLKRRVLTLTLPRGNKAGDKSPQINGVVKSPSGSKSSPVDGKGETGCNDM